MKKDVLLKLAGVAFVVLASSLFLLNIISSLNSEAMYNSLLEFERENFGERRIVEATRIDSGNVEIMLELDKFVKLSEGKTLYRTTSTELAEGVVYHFFGYGSDGELIEYFVVVQYHCGLFGANPEWKEYV